MDENLEKTVTPLKDELSINKKILRDFALLVFFALLLVGIVAIPSNGKKDQTANAKTSLESEVRNAESINPFDNLDLLAESVYVYDTTRDEVLFQKNEDKQLPLASLTKMMTAVTALSYAPEYTTITIDSDFLKSEGDVGLFANEKWTLKDLLNATLITSSNDGAKAIASVIGSGIERTENFEEGRHVFVKKMNLKAKEIGLEDSYFLNETGLDESRNISGAYGSAKDMAKLMKYALQTHSDIVFITKEDTEEFTSLSKIEHRFDNTNKAINEIPRIMASKTGFTDLAGGNLLVAIDAGFNRPIIISVLGSTAGGRFDDVTKLAWASLEYISEEENSNNIED